MKLPHASVWRVEASYRESGKPGRGHYCAAVVAAIAELAAEEVRRSLEAEGLVGVDVHSVTRPISGRCVVHITGEFET